MSSLKKTIPIFILFVLTLVFYWQIVVKGFSPFPGDMLIGAYLPWLDSKWGQPVGVAIKNPYITDIFSQIYIWKDLVSQSFKQLAWPLWNQYSYSGYPLLANFQSGALNPFNLIFIVFGMKVGWSIFMILGTFGCTASMYFLLKSFNFDKSSSLLASLTYAFSGFSILWMPYANANYALIWLPLIFLFINNYFKFHKTHYLFYIPLLFFLIIASGHYQIAIYSYIISPLYFVWRLKNSKIKSNSKDFLNYIYVLLLSIFIGSIQLLPTIELSNLSVRFNEYFIKTQNYGLSPLSKLFTLFAPDFFGNPGTNNYWGFFNYHETNFYVGIIGLLTLILSIYNYKKLGIYKFFLLSAVFCLILGFDNPIGRLFQQLPIISTSAAGRIASIFTFSIAVLIPKTQELLKKTNFIHLLHKLLPLIIIDILIFIIVFACKKFYLAQGDSLISQINNMNVSLRNMILPNILLFCFLISSLFRRHKIFNILIIFLTIFDLFRFGWKITPFVPMSYIFPTMPIIEKIKEDQDIFRIEKQNGEILPPNTWTAFGLMSPSGYDPLAYKNYYNSYNKDLNNSISLTTSRYTELFNYDALALGSFNVKYLFYKKGNLSAINLKDWTKVYETPSLLLLQNNFYQPRTSLIDENGKISSISRVSIASYQPNQVIIDYSDVKPGSRILLRDSWYPGWQALDNNNPVNIDKFQDVFRLVKINSTKGQLKFIYNPISFKIGLLISLLCFLLTLWKLRLNHR